MEVLKLIKQREIYTQMPIITTTLMASIGWHMFMPFLAIILSKIHNFSPIVIGTIAGIGPLMQSIFGLISGILIDKFGHQYSLIFSLFISGVLILSIYYSSWITMYILLYAILGMSYSFFNIGSKVSISVLTSEVNRLDVFNFQYIAFNIGAVIGPLLGGIFLAFSPQTIFLISASSFATAGVILAVSTTASAKEVSQSPSKKLSLRQNIHLLKDRSLVLILGANFVVWLCFSQVWTTLPQYLNSINLTNIYSYLLLINALVVIACQGFLSSIVKKFGRRIIVFCGVVCLALSYFIIAMLQNEVAFFVSIVLLTFSEMMLFPINNIIVDGKTTADSKGFLFGLFQLTMIGIPIGSICGSFILELESPQLLFEIVGICSLSLFVIYQKYFMGDNYV